MATLTLTFTGNNAGASARDFAQAAKKATAALPDNTAQNVTLTVDNAPATGSASIVVATPTPYILPVQIVG